MSLITLTSGMGCGAIDIAQQLGEKLGMAMYDDERLQEEAVAMGISSDESHNLDEKAPGLFNRLLRIKPDTYVEVMEALIYQVARTDKAIILGHGASFLLRDFGCALHVRIYSSESSRVDTLVNEQELTPDAARKLLRKSDNDRKGFMQFAFNMDWDDPSLYDVIINRDKLGAEGLIDLIVAATDTESISTCSLGALEAMERMSLEKQVETTIIKNFIHPEHFHVDVPEPGVVHLTGMINPLESKDKLIDIVKAVPGVRKVKGQLTSEKIHDI